MIYLQLHRKPLRTSRREPASWHSGTASGWNPPPLTPWFPHAFCETRQRSRFGNRTWHWRRKILQKGEKKIKKSMLVTDTRRQTNSKSEMRSKKTPNNKLTQLNVRVRGLFLLLFHQVCVTCKKHCKLNNGHKVNSQYLFIFPPISGGGGDVPRGSASMLLRLSWEVSCSLVLAGLLLARLSPTLSSHGHEAI